MTRSVRAAVPCAKAGAGRPAARLAWSRVRRCIFDSRLVSNGEGRGEGLLPGPLIYFSESGPDSQKAKVGFGEEMLFPPRPSFIRFCERSRRSQTPSPGPP